MPPNFAAVEAARYAFWRQCLLCCLCSLCIPVWSHLRLGNALGENARLISAKASFAACVLKKPEDHASFFFNR